MNTKSAARINSANSKQLGGTAKGTFPSRAHKAAAKNSTSGSGKK